MSYGGGYNGGRTRMGTLVVLNVYDLAPINEFLYPIGFGLHHSGVEIMGSEYSFASGGGVFESTPKQAPGAKFRETLELGSFDGGMAELQRALTDVRQSFGPDEYNLIRKNCNHFANALVWRLLGRRLPGHVNRLADIGVCCSCLLPKKLLEEAPVGDPNSGRGGSSGFTVSAGTRSSGGTSARIAAFSGSGATLGGGSESSAGVSSRLLGALSRGGSSARNEDLTDRREKARLAALARFERGNTEDASSRASDDNDRSR